LTSSGFSGHSLRMYKIIGADGKEYGPITAEQLRQWVAEGRANTQTRIRLEGTTEWKPLSEYPEFAETIPSAPPMMAGAPTPMMAAVPSVAALQQVSGPATGLIVVGILYFAAAAISLAFSLVGSSILATSQMSNPAIANMFSGSVGIISNILVFLLGGLILYGGVNMKKLENYGMAMAASIVAMLPCSACCVIGLPIGIWAVVVLSKPEVKSAFH
jgi:hypothetical protein